MTKQEREIALLKRANDVMRFLVNDPTETECQNYIDSQEYDIVSRKSAKLRLLVFAGLNVNEALLSVVR